MRLDHDTVRHLSTKLGDAFYIVDLALFSTNFLSMRDAFRSCYSSTNLAYSYKTNYLPRLCTSVDEWGGYAEVVSRFEYDLARRLGVNPARIIFNGPYRSEDDIRISAEDGALVNLDGPHQLEKLERVMASGTESARVGVRVTFPLDPARPSRFGFDASDLTFVFERLRSISGVSVEGIHCHFATGTRSTEAYRQIATTMVGIADTHFHGRHPRFIDLGGGFFSRMSDDLRRQFDRHIPTYEEYAEAIGGVLADRYGEDGPELILEPGVSVTADIMEFAAEVLETRTVNGRRIALVAGSVHTVKPTLNAMNLPMRVLSRVERAADERMEPTDIVGYTCMEHDVLFTGYRGSIQPGDFVVFENVGAYTNVLKPPFIRLAPPIAALEDGTIEVLRREETLDDIIATYAV